MSNLFPNYEIDLEKGTVKGKIGFIGLNKSKDGYSDCSIYDIYGNHYKRNHEVIVAEGLNLPKHLWPIDEKGKRFEVDHILPVSKGGTDSINNLRLVSKLDNVNNPNTIAKMCETRKGKPVPQFFTKEAIEKRVEKALIPVCQLTMDYELIKRLKSGKAASEVLGIPRSEICVCCKGGRMKKGKWIAVHSSGGSRWMYEEDYNKKLLEELIS